MHRHLHVFPAALAYRRSRYLVRGTVWHVDTSDQQMSAVFGSARRVASAVREARPSPGSPARPTSSASMMPPGLRLRRSSSTVPATPSPIHVAPMHEATPTGGVARSVPMDEREPVGDVQFDGTCS